MTSKKKVVFYADEDLVNWLSQEALRSGAPQGELCRRAVRLLACAETQTIENLRRTWAEKYDTQSLLKMETR
jgi:hypothetical protein